MEPPQEFPEDPTGFGSESRPDASEILKELLRREGAESGKTQARRPVAHGPSGLLLRHLVFPRSSHDRTAV